MAKTYDKVLNQKIDHKHVASDIKDLVILDPKIVFMEDDQYTLYGGTANPIYPTNQIVYGGNASTDYHGVLPILGGGAEW